MEQSEKKSDEVETNETESAFVSGVVARKEAGVADDSGKLPPGVTHEITGKKPDGTPTLVRRRFSSL